MKENLVVVGVFNQQVTAEHFEGIENEDVFSVEVKHGETFNDVINNLSVFISENKPDISPSASENLRGFMSEQVGTLDDGSSLLDAVVLDETITEEAYFHVFGAAEINKFED